MRPAATEVPNSNRLPPGATRWLPVVKIGSMVMGQTASVSSTRMSSVAPSVSKRAGSVRPSASQAFSSR